MEFTDISALLNKLATDIALEISLESGELAEEIIDVINEKSMDIYEMYEPHLYIRRYDKGGFGDRDNIKITKVNATNKNINVEFRNMTLGTQDPEPIDYNIEKAIYNYYPSNGEEIPERPIYEPAKQELEGGRLENKLKSILKSKGWEIV